MAKPIIRTYSKKQPVTVFNSAVTLVPSYPDPDNPNVRESQLQDTTLLANIFEDTFDRLATGVIVPSPKYSVHQSDSLYSINESINEHNSYIFQTQQDESKKKVLHDFKNEDKEKTKDNKIYDNIKSKENNLNVMVNKRTGIKRKINCENNVENFENTSYLNENEYPMDTVKFEEYVKKAKTIVNKKKQILPISEKDKQFNKYSLLLEKSNEDEDLSKSELNNIENSKVKKSSIIIKESKEFLNRNQFKGIEKYLFTSTPREQRLRMNVDIQNLSPIALDNDNENDQQNIKSLLIENENPKFDKIEILQSNSNNQNGMSIEHNELKSNIHNNIKMNTPPIDTKEFCNHIENKNFLRKKNDIDNNLSISKSFHNEFQNKKNNENICQLDNLVKQTSGTQTHIREEPLNETPIVTDIEVSFNESPLLFEDTTFNENVKKTTEFENDSTKSSKTDSFSLHEWSNEYDSSYEYFKQPEKNNFKKSTNFANNENFQNILKESSIVNNNIENELSNFLEKSCEQQTNIEKKIAEAIIVSNINDSKNNESINREKIQIINNKENENNQTKILTMKNVIETISEKKYKTNNIKNDNITKFNNTGKVINVEKIYQCSKEFDPKLSHLKPVVRISNLDYVNTKSRILSTKILQTTRLSAIQKNKNIRIKTIGKRINTKNVERNIVDDILITKRKSNSNKIEKNHSGATKHQLNITTSKKNFKRKVRISTLLNKNKDLRVLITRLEDLNIEIKSPIFIKKNTKQKSKKARNSKSINTENSFKDNTFVNIDDDTLVELERSIIEIHFQKDEASNKLNDQELLVLSKLNDAVNITRRKNSLRKLNRSLTAILENETNESINVNNENIQENILLEDNKMNNLLDDAVKNEMVFLKPGKSWVRSLSIINHFHNTQNLDELAIGRGQNWRHSVQSILNMQPDGIVQSVGKISDEERECNLYPFPILNTIQEEIKRISSLSNRFTRRFSTRIVPSGTISNLTEDFIDNKKYDNISTRTRNGLTKRKTSLITSNADLIKTEDDLIKSAKSIVLKRCKQMSYVPFNIAFPDSFINNCIKIGEGVYGEVFLYENNNKKSVVKIIPIEGEGLVNCEPQKKFHEILSEIIIAQELHKLKFGKEYNTNGFIGVDRIMCIIGSYPDKLIELWNKYDREKNSENDCPSMFNEQQLYIVLELAHGGQDLESFIFQNASECHSIFVQTALSLAVAEKSLEFEHRDLHWGNILISKTNDKKLIFKLNNTEVTLHTKGVKVSLIDFTLSRMSYQGCKIFNDLATDPTLFTAQGEYQFDIYRMMKDNVQNDWQQFKPYTNILWLDYLLDKMINAVRYRKKSTKIHKTSMERLNELRKELLNYESAFDFVKNCENIKSCLEIDGVLL